MKEPVITLNNSWEDNTVYKADREIYDIYLENTICVDDEIYKINGHTDPLNTAFFINGKNNITLDFCGAVVTLHGRLQPFLINNCENVTVKNVVVRYDRCPYTQGEIVAAGKDTLSLRVSDEFPYRTEDGELIITSDTWENRNLSKASHFIQFFDKQTRKGKGINLAVFGKNPTLDPALPWSASTVRFTAHNERGLLVLKRNGEIPMPSAAKVGNIAIIAHEIRNISNIHMVCCKNVKLETYRIINGFGMGIFPFHCENILLDGVKMTFDEHSVGIMANAADGIHAFSCKGDFTIKNTVVEGTIDDALNIHSNFYTVKSVSGNKITANTCHESLSNTPLFLPEDKIRIYNGHTLEKTCDYTILAVRPLEQKLVEFTLDRPALSHDENDVIENMSTQCNINISNCRFGKAATHLRFQSRGNILVENCETELPFLLTGDMNFWYESSPCEHFTVRDTVFLTENAFVRSLPSFEATKKEPYYHGDIFLENCRFDSCNPVTASHTKSVTMKNCKNSGGVTPTVTLTNCGDASCEDVEVVRITTDKSPYEAC